MKPDLTMEEYLDSYRLYYDPTQNVFIDGCGFVIHNIFNIINPNILYLFKMGQRDMVTYGKDGGPVLLFFEEMY